MLQLLASGWTPAEVTEELVIALTTLNNHVRHIMEKLGVHRRTDGVALAHRLGLPGRLPPPTKQPPDAP